MREIGKNAFAIEEEGEEWQASASSQVQIALKSSAESKGSGGGACREAFVALGTSLPFMPLLPRAM